MIIDDTHHLGLNYFVNFLGHLDSNGFQLKGRFDTDGNEKIVGAVYLKIGPNGLNWQCCLL
jgi:hypothetical protein